MQYYGIDLRDLFRDDDPLSPRFVLALVINLTKEGAFFASRRGGQQYRGWTEQTYALAKLVDSVEAGNHLFTLAHRDPKKSKPKPPRPYPRPDDMEPQKAAPKPGSFAAMVVAAKAALRRKKEAMSG